MLLTEPILMLILLLIAGVCVQVSQLRVTLPADTYCNIQTGAAKVDSFSYANWFWQKNLHPRQYIPKRWGYDAYGARISIRP